MPPGVLTSTSHAAASSGSWLACVAITKTPLPVVREGVPSSSPSPSFPSPLALHPSSLDAPPSASFPFPTLPYTNGHRGKMNEKLKMNENRRLQKEMQMKSAWMWERLMGWQGA